MMPRALPPAGFAAEKKTVIRGPGAEGGGGGQLRFFFSFDAQMSSFTPLPREILTHTLFFGGG